MDIRELLDKLADSKSAIDLLRFQQEELVESILTEEQRIQIGDIRSEFGGKIESFERDVKQLEDSIKALVSASGESVKGTKLHAVFISGKTTWDGRGLSGYAVAHPEICAFAKTGEPSVQIRVVK